MEDWAANIPDRNFYRYTEYPYPEHLLFAPWLGYGELHRHLAVAAIETSAPRYYFLEQACLQGLASGAGEVWELGVYQGATAAFLGSIAGPDRTTSLFDTFGGMPETDAELDPFHVAGDFGDTSLEHVKARVSRVAANIEFHPGFVPDTFAGLENSAIAFAHVDLDIYHPIKASCEFIFPRLNIGGVMLFDDYGWASCPGARQAVDEFFANRPEQVFWLPTGQAMVFKLAG